MTDFLQCLGAIPPGYSTGQYLGCRYATTLEVSADGKRLRLFAQQLGGNDHVSFNLYRLRQGQPLLKPCEMPKQKVIDFVLGYRPDDGQDEPGSVTRGRNTRAPSTSAVIRG